MQMSCNCKILNNPLELSCLLMSIYLSNFVALVNIHYSCKAWIGFFLTKLITVDINLRRKKEIEINEA